MSLSYPPLFCRPPVQRLLARVCPQPICSIFGTHDWNKLSDTNCAKYLKKEKKKPNNLGKPIGLVPSKVLAKTADKGGDPQATRYAIYMKSLAKLYLTTETQWTSITLDNLIGEGVQHAVASAAKPKQLNEEGEPIVVTSNIYSPTELKVDREFDLDGNTFAIELEEKFRMDPNPVEKVGDENQPQDPPLKYLKTALKQFFERSNYCLLKVARLYYLIWKAKNMYFILDYNGRKVVDFLFDKDRGVAMLICLNRLDNLVTLINNYTLLPPTETFTLREMKVVKLSFPDGKSV